MQRTTVFWLVLVGLASAAVMTQADPGDTPRRGPPEREGREGPGGPRPPVPMLERALDTDDDGEISAEEIAAAPAALKKLDKNDDGKLTPDEYHPRRPRRDRPESDSSPGQGRRPPMSDDDRPRPPRPKDGDKEKDSDKESDGKCDRPPADQDPGPPRAAAPKDE